MYVVDPEAGLAVGGGDEAALGVGPPGVAVAITLGEAVGVDAGVGVNEGVGEGDEDAETTPPPGDLDGTGEAVVQAASVARAMSRTPSRGRRRAWNLVRVIAQIRGGDRRQ